MHDTALRIGSLAVKAYVESKKPKILEVGSQIVNGSLRGSAPAGAQWIGVDIEEGLGVDVVVEPGAPLPFDDAHFDLVLATSVFEHDPAFWLTFVEMCRKAKPGGFVYVSAPSNGMVHRYPRDYWRFYPDAGLALVDVGKASGVDVELVESFIADQEEAGWNDFVAIFRRGGVDDPLPDDFIYANIACANILTWQSSTVIEEREATEDQVRLNKELANVQHLVRVNEEDRRAMAAEREVWEAARAALARTAAEGMVAKQRLTELEANNEELEALRTTNAHLDQDRELLLSELAKERAAKDSFVDSFEHVRAELDRLQAQSVRLSGELESIRSEKAKLDDEYELLLQEFTKERAAKDALAETLNGMTAEVSELRAQSKKADEWVFTLSAERRRAEEERDLMQLQIATLHERLSLLLEEFRTSEDKLFTTSESLRETQRELSALKRSARESETLAKQRERQLQWLRKAEEIIATNAPGWRQSMPSTWRRKKDLEALKRNGLFDHSKYLEKYPDVGAAGMDPLQHYILHGMAEGRLATFSPD